MVIEISATPGLHSNFELVVDRTLSYASSIMTTDMHTADASAHKKSKKTKSKAAPAVTQADVPIDAMVVDATGV